MSGYTTPTSTKRKQAQESAQAAASETGLTHAVISATYGTLGTNFHVVPETKAEDYMRELEQQVNSVHYSTSIEEIVKP